MYCTRTLWAIVVVLIGSSPASASLLVNGGFENPILSPNTFQTIGVGAEPAGFGWTVDFGDVDVGHLPLSAFVDFPAFEGNQGLDLNGFQRGGIHQDFATVVGEMYRLSFTYADNPFEGGVSTADVSISDVATSNSLLATSISHSTSTNGTAALGDGDADADFFSMTFVATGTLTRMSFASTSASNTASGGIFLDDVSVDGMSTVPEPSTLILFGFGGIVLIGYSQARRRFR